MTTNNSAINKYYTVTKTLEMLVNSLPKYSKETLSSELHVLASLLQKELFKENKVKDTEVNINDFKFRIEIIYSKPLIIKVGVKHKHIRYFNDTYSVQFSSNSM